MFTKKVFFLEYVSFSDEHPLLETLKFSASSQSCYQPFNFLEVCSFTDIDRLLTKVSISINFQ